MFGSYVIDSLGFLGIIDRPRSHLPGQGEGAVHERGGQREMLSASVLIQTEASKVPHVAWALSDLGWCDDLADPYDVIARVQASGLDQLSRLVVSRIQVVDGVTRTLTWTVLQR